MAIGNGKTPVSGRYGRISPAPHGQIYVRDEAAAVAAAVKQKVELFESLGLEVPEFLQAQAAEAGAGGEEVTLVTADCETQDSWRLISDAEQGVESEGEPAPAPAEEPAVEEPAAEEAESEPVEESAEAEEAPKPRRRPAKKADSTEE